MTRFGVNPAARSCLYECHFPIALYYFYFPRFFASVSSPAAPSVEVCIYGGSTLLADVSHALAGCRVCEGVPMSSRSDGKKFHLLPADRPLPYAAEVSAIRGLRLSPEL